MEELEINFKVEFFKKSNKVELKTYDSLYDELLDKTQPSNFIQIDNQKALSANVLYQQIRSQSSWLESELRQFVDSAEKELDVSFSNEALKAQLLKECDPKQFEGSSFDSAKLTESISYNQKIEDASGDIVALYQLKKEIKQWKTQSSNSPQIESQEEDDTGVVVGVIIAIIFVSILVIGAILNQNT